MTSLLFLTDEGLVQQLALYNNTPETLRDIKLEIGRRIIKKSQFRQSDAKLIDQLIKIAEEIEGADFDLLGESQRMKKLSTKYYKLKKQLLLRIKNENSIPYRIA